MPRRIACGGADLDDAEERHGGARSQLVEHDVRGVGGHRREVHARPGQSLQRFEQVLDERLAIGGDQAQRSGGVETVDDERGRTRGIVPLPRLENAAVVVDRGFRPQAADESNRSQRGLLPYRTGGFVWPVVSATSTPLADTLTAKVNRGRTLDLFVNVPCPRRSASGLPESTITSNQFGAVGLHRRGRRQRHLGAGRQIEYEKHVAGGLDADGRERLIRDVAHGQRVRLIPRRGPGPAGKTKHVRGGPFRRPEAFVERRVEESRGEDEARGQVRGAVLEHFGAHAVLEDACPRDAAGQVDFVGAARRAERGEPRIAGRFTSRRRHHDQRAGDRAGAAPRRRHAGPEGDVFLSRNRAVTSPMVVNMASFM